jgi:hypothetical protein
MYTACAYAWVTMRACFSVKMVSVKRTRHSICFYRDLNEQSTCEAYEDMRRKSRKKDMCENLKGLLVRKRREGKVSKLL